MRHLSAALAAVLHVDADFTKVIWKVMDHYSMPVDVMEDLVQQLCLDLIQKHVQINPTLVTRYMWVLLQRRARDLTMSKAWSARSEAAVPEQPIVEDDSTMRKVFLYLDNEEVMAWVLQVWADNLRPKEMEVMRFWMSHPDWDTNTVSTVFGLNSPSFIHKTRQRAAFVMQQVLRNQAPECIAREMVRVDWVNPR